MGWPRRGKLGKNISGGSGLKGDDQVLMGGDVTLDETMMIYQPL